MIMFDSLMTRVVDLETNKVLYNGEFEEIPDEVRSEYIPIRFRFDPLEQIAVVGVVTFKRGK